MSIIARVFGEDQANDIAAQLRDATVRKQWNGYYQVMVGEMEANYLDHMQNQNDLIASRRQITDHDLLTLYEAGIDWQYLIVLGDGMARKSDLDAWLIDRFGIDPSLARSVSNGIEYRCPRYFSFSWDRVEWNNIIANRLPPRLEDYGGWDKITLHGKIGLR